VPKERRTNMKMRLPLKWLVISMLALTGMAVSIDRAALLIWKYRVMAYHEKINHPNKLIVKEKAVETDCIYMHYIKGDESSVLATITFNGIKPDIITAYKNPLLIFYPPKLAWSQYLALMKYSNNREEYDLQLFFRSYRIMINHDMKNGVPIPSAYMEYGEIAF
jgi:hypothetical protein